MALYDLNNIIHRYNGKTVLSVDQYRIEEGAILGLKGPNGSGKSTLLNILGFIHRPSRGEIFFRGRSADPFSAGIRDQITLLPQTAYLLRRTVYDNIAYALRIRRHNGDIRRRIHDALTLVGLSPGKFDQRPWFALSGGEAHRVALAARMVPQPKVLLLDEPTASVDDASTQIIKEAVLHAHRHWGTTLIIASHDEDWLEDICDLRLHLHQGKTLGSGNITLIYGPWEKKIPGLLVRKLSPTQEFRAPADPHPGSDATAALDLERFSTHRAQPTPSNGTHCLEGRIRRLYQDKPSGRIKASVQVGNIVLSTLLPEAQDSTPQYFPGQTIWLTYNLSHVQWP